jgi:hypothetical protein
MAFNAPVPQFRYGHCDTYFVEEDVEMTLDRVREHKDVVQRKLGDELSNRTADEYAEDTLQHMKEMEVRVVPVKSLFKNLLNPQAETIPDVNSIDIQTEIQWYMRPYLLDFLIEAHAAFQLLPETLFLAINLLDRYCSRRVVYKRHYQLVGCAALLIASKYGDKKERVPTVRELRSMCCSLYDEEMFIQMEWHVLQTLNWVIGHPTIDSFLEIILEGDGEKDIEAQHMTLYICELALFHKEFISVTPSVLARSALALSRCILGRTQTRQSGWAGEYDASVILNLASHLQSPSQVLARKYSAAQLGNVATTVAIFVDEQNRKNQPPAAASNGSPLAPVYANSSSTLPQTPQKSVNPYGAAVMNNGCLTPPITPENDQGFQAGFSKPMMPGQAFPPTPSPLRATHHVTGPSPVSLHPHSHQHPSYIQTQFVQ